MTGRRTTAAVKSIRRNAVAWLALFVALGGTGYAAATIGPGDIRDDAVRARHIAEGAVWSGQLHDGAIRARDLGDQAVGSQAIRNDRVFSADIRNGTVRGADIGDDAVGSAQIAPHSVDDFQIQAGAIGANKLAGVFTHSSNFFTEAGDTVVRDLNCPFGQRLLSGGYFGAQDGLRVVASFPRLRYPDAEDGWEIEVENTSSLPKSMNVVATCLETSH